MTEVKPTGLSLYFFYLFWLFLAATGAALNLTVFSLSKAKEKPNNWGAPLGREVGKQIQRKKERQRVPYVGEKHVLINTVFLLFQLRGHTLNEDRQQGRRLDRGGKGRGRWELIEELGIMCSGQSLNQLFSIQWESERWNVAGGWTARRRSEEDEEQEGDYKTLGDTQCVEVAADAN